MSLSAAEAKAVWGSEWGFTLHARRGLKLWEALTQVVGSRDRARLRRWEKKCGSAVSGEADPDPADSAAGQSLITGASALTPF